MEREKERERERERGCFNKWSVVDGERWGRRPFHYGSHVLDLSVRCTNGILLLAPKTSIVFFFPRPTFYQVLVSSFWFYFPWGPVFFWWPHHSSTLSTQQRSARFVPICFVSFLRKTLCWPLKMHNCAFPGAQLWYDEWCESYQYITSQARSAAAAAEAARRAQPCRYGLVMRFLELWSISLREIGPFARNRHLAMEFSFWLDFRRVQLGKWGRFREVSVEWIGASCCFPILLLFLI